MVVRRIVVDMGGELGCDGRGNNFTALWTLTIRSVGRIYFVVIDGWTCSWFWIVMEAAI